MIQIFPNQNVAFDQTYLFNYVQFKYFLMKEFLWYHAESLSSVFGQPVLHFLLQNSKLRKRTIHNNDYFSFRREPCVKYTNNICHTCPQYLALHGIPCKDNFINRVLIYIEISSPWIRVHVHVQYLSVCEFDQQSACSCFVLASIFLTS